MYEKYILVDCLVKMSKYQHCSCLLIFIKLRYIVYKSFFQFLGIWCSTQGDFDINSCRNTRKLCTFFDKKSLDHYCQRPNFQKYCKLSCGLCPSKKYLFLVIFSFVLIIFPYITIDIQWLGMYCTEFCIVLRSIADLRM